MLHQRTRHATVYFRAGARLCAMPAERVAQLGAVPSFIRCWMLPKTVLGVTNIGGAIMPLVDLNLVLDAGAGSSGEGELAVVRLDGGMLALKVDKVLQVSAARRGGGETKEVTDLIEQLDSLLAELSFVPSRLQPALPARMTDRPVVSTDALISASPRSKRKRPSIGVESGKGVVYLSYDCIEMLSEALTIARVPDPNPIFLGVTIHRSRAIPVVSLDALLGKPPSPASSEAFVMARFRQRTIAIAVRRIMQLSADQDEPLDLETLLQPLLSGEGDDDAVAQLPLAPDPFRRYLLFDIGGQCCGFDLTEVDRVETENKVISVPRDIMRVNGLTNIGGDVLPLLDIAPFLGLKTNLGPAGAFLVVKDPLLGRVAVPVDRLRRIMPIPDAALLKLDAQTELEAVSDYGGARIWFLSIARFAERAGWRQNADRSI